MSGALSKFPSSASSSEAYAGSVRNFGVAVPQSFSDQGLYNQIGVALTRDVVIRKLKGDYKDIANRFEDIFKDLRDRNSKQEDPLSNRIARLTILLARFPQ